MGVYETPRDLMGAYVTPRDFMGACETSRDLMGTYSETSRDLMCTHSETPRDLVGRTDVSAERAAFTFSVQDLLFRREIGQHASPILWYISKKNYTASHPRKFKFSLQSFFFSSEKEHAYRMAEEHVIARLLYESIAVVTP